jgi:dipeptidyl aminopeptidase/acylaminoacyl peptidase
MYALILIALTLTTLGMLAPTLIHRAYRAPRVRERGTPAALGLPFRTVQIPTANGKHLFAWLVPPTRVADEAPAVVVMHGWGGNAEQMLPFAALLHREGYAVLLFDARNHGNSDADGHSSMPRFSEDLEHAVQWLTQQPGIDPGRLVLHYIERAIGARFDDIAPCNTIRRASCPVLLVHGEDDARIPPADALRIYANRHDDRTELMLLPHTGHESREAVKTYGDALTAFIRRSLPSTV